MGNAPELQQCEANTRQGKRCARKGTIKRKRKVQKRSWLFFTKEEVVNSYYCQQHRNAYKRV